MELQRKSIFNSSSKRFLSLFLLIICFLVIHFPIQVSSSITSSSSSSTNMGSLPENHQAPLGAGSALPNPIREGNFVHNNTVPPKEQKVFALFNNTGKTAIVTGASAGIGLAVAQALAESGANVAIWYHSSKEADLRAKEIETEYKVKCKSIISPFLKILLIFLSFWLRAITGLFFFSY